MVKSINLILFIFNSPLFILVHGLGVVVALRKVLCDVTNYSYISNIGLCLFQCKCPLPPPRALKLWSLPWSMLYIHFDNNTNFYLSNNARLLTFTVRSNILNCVTINREAIQLNVPVGLHYHHIVKWKVIRNAFIKIVKCQGQRVTASW